MTPFDPGLQPERTALSWQRTSLALLVGSLTAARVAMPAAGRWALLAGALGCTCALLLMALSRRRHRRGTASLEGPGHFLATGGWLPLAASLMTLAGGLFLTVVLLLG
ncbi:DUF202 domain-containing protein [Luteococcus sp. Sow4_B9]|uniref:DUF202 domain-containing protein n=1 Tax=Luteococcus sp. Sow4_B9 TaxID=3438792 RepID=UPI003F9586B9